ncbi:MAG: Fe-Mn family superoxide dismutase [Bacteroidales bacterium]|nr:Fe-Mn family superoxide dismutase [Bacteroidales bacterium]
MFELPKLPFDRNSLEPFISAETIDFHYGKHHHAYVNNLNSLIVGTPFENAALEDIVMKSEGGIFNNAAQVWNHTFYWNSLAPQSETPSTKLLQIIDSNFGSLDQLKEQFLKAAAANFGSGWTWLVKTADGKLKISSTSNADNPLKHNEIPILTCDVWEHAYYIDYRNARPRYLEAFWKIIHWKMVENRWLNENVSLDFFHQ